MKMVFRGWSREVQPHTHAVSAIKKTKGYAAIPGSNPITWSGPLQAFGKIQKVALTGAFLVEFNFEDEELRNWLKTYVKAKPAEALRLLAEAQAEAVIALQRLPAEASKAQ